MKDRSDSLTHDALPDEIAEVVRDLAAMGFGDHQIARSTRLSVEQVRRILAERRGPTGGGAA